jgi:hypothetical protein
LFLCVEVAGRSSGEPVAPPLRAGELSRVELWAEH